MDITTPLINQRDHVPHVFGLFYRMRQQPVSSQSIVWSTPGETHPWGFSCSPLLMPMPISRCCHASRSLVLFPSHAARLTGVHLVADPMLRSRSVDVRLIRSPATLPHAVVTQVTQVICVGICILTAYICVTEASVSETRRSESVSRHVIYTFVHATLL